MIRTAEPRDTYPMNGVIGSQVERRPAAEHLRARRWPTVHASAGASAPRMCLGTALGRLAHLLKRRAERVKVRADVYLHSRESLLETHHDVAWFDVPLNQLLLVHRSQAVGDLRRNFECQLYLEPTQAFDKFLERFPPRQIPPRRSSSGRFCLDAKLRLLNFFTAASCSPFVADVIFVHPNLLADRDQFW
jgi:hypothetical protein